jgi:hypothetical protein
MVMLVPEADSEMLLKQTADLGIECFDTGVVTNAGHGSRVRFR